VTGSDVNAAHGRQSVCEVACCRVERCRVVAQVRSVASVHTHVAMSDSGFETQSVVAVATSIPAGAPAGHGVLTLADEGSTPDVSRLSARVPTSEVTVPRRRRNTRFTAPTVHFPAQQCPLCNLGRMFNTRNGFSNHLKEVHDSFWCATTGKIRPLHRQGMTHKGAGRPIPLVTVALWPRLPRGLRPQSTHLHEGSLPRPHRSP